MAKQGKDGQVHVIDGKKKPCCRKTVCYKCALFIVAVVLSSLIIACVVVVVLRGHLMPPEKIPVQVGNLELRIKKDVYKKLMDYFDKVDVKRNGTISLDTALEYFDKLDTNKNRVLTLQEFTTEEGEGYKFVFEAEDINGDGVIRRGQIGDMHNRIDIDDDGIISRDEFILYHDLVRRAIYEREAL